MNEVPVIDISALIKGDEEGSKALVREIQSSCEYNCVFYITGHGISKQISSNLLEKGRQFFKLPLKKKQALSFKRSKAFRGYFHRGAEVTAGKPDVKEGFFCGPDVASDHKDVLTGLPMVGPNRFPDESDVLGFSVAVKNYTNVMTNIGMLLTSAIVNGFGVGKEFMQSTFNPPFYNMTLWHYPTTFENTDEWGIGPHTDYEAVTILLQDEIGGLQTQTKDGLWVDIPPKEGTFVVMLGDVFECWTNGLYRAPIHRVKKSLSASRYSAAFFFQPNIETTVKPIDMAVIRNRKYIPTRKNAIPMPFNYGDNLERSYAEAFYKV